MPTPALGYCPRLRGTARWIPAGGAAPRAARNPRGAGLRGAHHRPRRRGHRRTLRLLSPPPAPPGVRLRSLPRLSATQEGWRSAWRRLRARRPFAPGSARASRRARGHLPARAPLREEGADNAAGMQPASRADQTLSTKASGVYRQPPPAGAGISRDPIKRWLGRRGLGLLGISGLL